MSAVIPPRALYMILCDEVVRDEQHLGKLTAAGVTTLIEWNESHDCVHPEAGRSSGPDGRPRGRDLPDRLPQS